MNFHQFNFEIAILIAFTAPVCGKSTLLDDISTKCHNKPTKGPTLLSHYLTNGLDESDYVTGLIATNDPNCNVYIFVDEFNYVVLVIEFPDWMPGRYDVCGNEVNHTYKEGEGVIVNKFLGSVDKYIVIGDEIANVCQFLKDNQRNSVTLIGPKWLWLEFHPTLVMTAMKFTATSVRRANDSRCDIEKEVSCYYNHTEFCMTSYVACDGVPNCGHYGLYDEDRQTCSVRLSALLIVYSLTLIILNLFLLVAAIVSLWPKRKERFIYRMDESKHLYDYGRNMRNLDLSINVFYPEDVHKQTLENLSSKSYNLIQSGSFITRPIGIRKMH